MAQTGWNKVIESTGNVYYHNKHTGHMQFAPPPSVPDNVPLKRALKMQSYEKVRDNHGCATRAYPVGKGVYVSASQFESIKYVHVGVYTKSSHGATPRATGDGIAIDEGVWNELCKNKNLISEVVSYYRTSNVNGVPQIVAQSHPEKLRLLLGKQTYVTLTSEKEVFVNIQTFDHAMQTINGIDGSTSQHWTVVPGANGISLNFDQWYKLTSLESLFAIEHLKALAKVPVILKAKKRPRSPSSPPPTLSKRRKANLKLDIPPATTTLETIKEEEEETKPTTVI